jgi:hypothetical protein
MDPLIGGSLISMGGNLLGGLGKMLFGNGDRARLKQFAQYLKGQLVNPQDFANQMTANDWQANAPRFNQIAENTNKRLGLDSGVAQAEMNSGMQDTIAKNRVSYVQSGIDQNQQVRAMLSNLYSSLLR